MYVIAQKLLYKQNHIRFSRTKPVYGELCHHMLANGVVTTPRGIFGCLSTPMTAAELNLFVEALDRSLTALGYAGGL